MAFIYKITNIVNGKVYIGKTEKENPEERLQEHFNDYLRRPFEKRPLYDAIKKYGKENFIFEVLEETENPEDREIYYIKKYNSYIGCDKSNGYNATLGGDGAKYIDYDFVVKYYIEENKKTIKKVAEDLNIHKDTVSYILNKYKIKIREPKIYSSFKVLQIDKKSNAVLNEFDSLRDAAKFLGDKRKRQHISETCEGKRKSAYGFKWAYKNNNSK